MRVARTVLATVLATGLGAVLALPATGPASSASPLPAGSTPALPALTLVTLEGPGTSGANGDTGHDRPSLLATQDEVLAAAGVDEPVYRWTTALNGFAAHLTPDQAAQIRNHPTVQLVEANSIHQLAHTRRPTAAEFLGSVDSGSPRLTGGAGVVLAVVDSGIAPESPVFAAVPGLGRSPRSFDGTCQPGQGWTPDTCTSKVIGARWFVAGFGRDRIRTSESLSPLDTLGHGTQVASVAAGNASVTVRIDNHHVGQFGGVAPQARIAAYKACWAAPDPADDGCSTADLVTAIDRAVSDHVDVLNLSVAGGEGLDTVQHALLGAAEADIVVVGSAGNAADDAHAAHPSPWVTTVGATVGELPRARVRIGDQSFTGTGRTARVSGKAVLAGRVAAPGVNVRRARKCHPGSLDAREVAGRIVVCERGGLGRIDKSRAVAQADGIAMVLTNVRRGNETADFHAVPTVHLGVRAARDLGRLLRRRPRATVQLSPAPDDRGRPRSAPWSASGNPRASVLKPDVVAAGDGALSVVPDNSTGSGTGWAVLTGTSASAARVSGTAPVLRGRHDWSAALVRSALTTTAQPVPAADVLAQGNGAVSGEIPVTHLGLDVDPSAWRRALERRRFTGLNLPSAVLTARKRSFTREVTNVGRRDEYFSVEARGFDAHQLRVRPLAVRLAPGETATFRVRVTGPDTPRRLDDGYVVWRGARGGETRLAVAITR